MHVTTFFVLFILILTACLSLSIPDLNRSAHSPSRREREYAPEEKERGGEKEAKLTKRQKMAVLASQKKATARLVSQDTNANGGIEGTSGDF